MRVDRSTTVICGLVTALTAAAGLWLLGTSTAGTVSPDPAADALAAEQFPSRVLGLSGHRRLLRELEQDRERARDRVRARRSPEGGRGPRPAAGPGGRAAGVPLRVRIPALDVDLPLRTGPARDPATLGTLGGTGVFWDAGGPVPGGLGMAVLVAGARAGCEPERPPGAGGCLELAALPVGRTVEVPRADGQTAVFTVDRVERAADTRGRTPAGVRAGAGREARTGVGLRLSDGTTVVWAHGPRALGPHHPRTR
ncbi:hypothetical protein ACN20G_12895 [Streptomyces sp. BI20]|uniref:hypothetical protein n=1 Tax=Streptomyces sp. BI20 TaxID=3403460 RepID=UPI003C75C819